MTESSSLSVGANRTPANRNFAVAALFAFSVLCILSLMAHGNLENSDAGITWQSARALVLRGETGLSTDGETGAERVVAGVIAAGEANGVPNYGMTGVDGQQYPWFPIGHIYLMTPAVLLGQAAAEAWPAPEARMRAAFAAENQLGTYDVHARFVWEQLALCLLPVLLGALSAFVLYRIARVLGAGCRHALIAAGTTLLCAQTVAVFTETLSDGPGLAFLLLGLWGVLSYRRHESPRGYVLLLSGLATGAAVLCRYPHASLAAALVVSVVLSARRHGRLIDVGWFVVGGAPSLVLLLAVNHARYGDAFETGYGNTHLVDWMNYPLPLGLFMILFAFGKGIAWLSPPLWLALPGALRPRRLRDVSVRHELWLALVIFALPILFFSNTVGWQSGQVWGVRYVTPSVAVLCIVVFSLFDPRARHPWVFSVLASLGLFLTVTHAVAPTRGWNQLAAQATSVSLAEETARGDVKPGNYPEHYFYLPRYSPVFTHWIYAWLSATGRFDAGPAAGAENTIGPMFGEVDGPPAAGAAPVRFEERGFRHNLWVLWSRLLQAPLWVAALLVGLCGVGSALWAWKLAGRADQDPAQSAQGRGAARLES